MRTVSSRVCVAATGAVRRERVSTVRVENAGAMNMHTCFTSTGSDAVRNACDARQSGCEQSDVVWVIPLPVAG